LNTSAKVPIDIARETALKILYEVNEKGAYSNISLNKHLNRDEIRDVDRGFITEIVYGTVKWKLTIDWIISRYSSVRINRISSWVLNILRMGIYQILYMDRVPDSAACNESVNLAKKYGNPGSVGFVNGLLRNISRNREKLRIPEKKDGLVEYLSVRYSHPEWMVEKFLGLFGEKFTEELLECNNKVPDYTVRVNTLKITREGLVERLKGSEVEADAGRYCSEALIFKNPPPLSGMSEFEEGLFQVQDESSMLAVKILDPRPGEFIIDVCSAPGGKATHIAELMGNRGIVIARDVHEHKIKLIDDALKRLGISIVKTELFDAVKADEKLFGKADRVLVDAPCSGLGIIRRKPDIKWARKEKDLEEIRELQIRILEAASKYVKPGGFLVYSTCTVLPEENQDVVEKFLEGSACFETDDISPLLPANLRWLGPDRWNIQLFPNRDGVDGFFIARLRKRD